MSVSATRSSTEYDFATSLNPGKAGPTDGRRHDVKWRQALKRGFDILAAGSMLTLTLPLLATVALAIRLESRGPILFRQERVGLQGRTFTLAKLRTMRCATSPEGNPVWACERDPRITRVGAVLRRHRIDELPQLINVLTGEMSLVGPRPEVPHYVERLARELPDYHVRHEVKPGLTGLAQVAAGYAGSLEESRAKLAHDLEYVRSFGLRQDLRILLRTVPVVLAGTGAR